VDQYLKINQSRALSGEVSLFGAKNAVLVIMASLLLTNGKSRLHNVPVSSDVLHMMKLLQLLGAHVYFDMEQHILEIDTTLVNSWQVSPDVMQKMRASILVMGPLLARFGKANIALPGGCTIGARPIDYHLKNFEKMGVAIEIQGTYLKAQVSHLSAKDLVLDYPSVGATENVMMAAIFAQGTTRIINAALEPEVLDLIAILQKMGAAITIEAPATIKIQGQQELLQPVEHEIIPDRLEAGALLLAAAITGGSIAITNACADHLAVFLLKLSEMGHMIVSDATGIRLIATKNPIAISFKTGPYPSFPTDLQAPMMAAQCVAQGKSIIEETVFENRFLHIRELQKMGAVIAIEGNRAVVTGVDELFGTHVIATDIRGSCALALAGLAAKGTTIMTGVTHWQRCYDHFEQKLAKLGADIALKSGDFRRIYPRMAQESFVYAE
jgi:UDP-N-acetylglucosamine 1-carboxyvinyltransferase